MLFCACELPSLIISLDLFSYWRGAISQQGITWGYVEPDLSRHTASLGHIKLSGFKYFIANYYQLIFCSLHIKLKVLIISSARSVYRK